ncbi:6428_t:CDS:2 [Ambispora gerdemannii]|uniref:6428_t:CDS:1 n=1 Tax=Ambispora gerdemannii TaxID=144530 RepID=A0A9N9FQV0_9GLOM|nr:6428_t:CDS:2 [Ambispora gerdemannii]
MKNIIRDKKEFELPEWMKQRFWRPVTFYLYGDGGAGKTGLINKLFFNNKSLYNKPENQTGKNYWNGYNGQEIIFFDEFFSKISWSDMVNILNDTNHNVEKKYEGFTPLLSKYIFLTSTKSPEQAYNFNDYELEDGTQLKNKKSLKQFMRRLDYVIKFTGEWDDDLEKCTIQIEIEKGNKDDFYNIFWDLKYSKDDLTIEELVERVKKINKDIDDYPQCEELSYYKKKFIENKNKRKLDNVENNNIENNNTKKQCL